VDPEKRYTIDEFLAHPWCNETHMPPPPLAPIARNGRDIFTNRPLDSPLLSAALGRPEGRSPGLATLKEAFDITYAVHRMEEEGARRRKYRGNGMGVHRFLGGLNEDDEDEEAIGSDNLPDAARQIEPFAKGFELDLDGATLLGRRHRRNVGVNASGALPSLQGNGSPLKLETLRIGD